MIIDENAQGLIHAHAMGPEGSMPASHQHQMILDPGVTSPSTVHAMTKFPNSGLYKMWIQFQIAGKVQTVPFVLRVQ